MGMGAGIMMVAGGVTKAYGQYQAGKANSAISKYNAKISALQAQDALERGREAESRSRINTRGQIGAQRAALAAQGIEVNEGTAADIQEDTAYFGELDALTIRNNAALEAWGYRTQGADTRMRDQFARQETRSQVAGTLLTTGGQAASQYARTQ